MRGNSNPRESISFDDGTEYSTTNILDEEDSNEPVPHSNRQKGTLSPPRERKIPSAVSTLVKTFFLPHVKGYFQTETSLPLLKKTTSHCMADIEGKLQRIFINFQISY